jgi:hypothetical protein
MRAGQAQSRVVVVLGYDGGFQLSKACGHRKEHFVAHGGCATEKSMEAVQTENLPALRQKQLKAPPATSR